MLSEPYQQSIVKMQTELAQLLSERVMRFAEDNAEAIPEAPGIYLIEENNRIVYAGSAQNLRLRLWREHYRGEQVRVGGSQFRGILIKVHPNLTDDKELTEHIGQRCSFAFLAKESIEKRDLKFLEDFCNAVLRPDFIKYNAKDKIWGTPQRRAHPIIYNCDDCGKEFPSGRQRSGLKLCKDCAERRRREGRGPIQLLKRTLR